MVSMAGGLTRKRIRPGSNERTLAKSSKMAVPDSRGRKTLITMTEIVRPIIGDDICDTPSAERTVEQKGVFGSWRGRFQ
jgi:hypothetical protein